MHGDFIMSDNLKFSLIMATLGRDKEIAAFCKSLAAQTYKNYELIIVDQNDDERLIPIIEAYETKFSINHIRSLQKGLSHNRNIGLQYALGDIIAFPDDDCEYKSDTLEKALEYLKSYDFVSFCRSNNIDDKSKSYPNNHSFLIIPRKFFYAGPSYTLFMRKYALENFKFDEQMGCGAYYGSGEESDMVLYMLSKNKRGYFSCENRIYHPYKNPSDDYDRLFSYALGFGALYKKAVTSYRFKFLYFQFLKFLTINILSILLGRKRKENKMALYGKIKGFISYKGR